MEWQTVGIFRRNTPCIPIGPHLFVLCKLSESYLFWTESWLELEWRISNNRFFGGNLCTNQAAFTRIIMYIIDLVSFFPDRSYGVPSARSFILLGLSTWTPWREIYAKLLATAGWSAKYGMLLFIRCIGDIYFQLTTFSSCFIIKFFQIRILRGVRYELLHSLWARVIEDSRDIFFLMAMRRISFFAQSLTTHIPEQYGRSSSWCLIILKSFFVFTWYYQGRGSIYSSHTSRVLEALTSSWMGQPC